MDRLIYTALAGINERRPQRQVEANDLANVSTVGFKSFDQALIAIKTRGDGYDTRIQPQVGLLIELIWNWGSNGHE